MAISHAAAQPSKWLSGVRTYRWHHKHDECDDLDDKPPCFVSCFCSSNCIRWEFSNALIFCVICVAIHIWRHKNNTIILDFITITGRRVRHLSLCLKCNLGEFPEPYGSAVSSRGFVAPNTGDRLCGITVCVVSVQLILWKLIQIHHFFLDDRSSPAFFSIHDH